MYETLEKGSPLSIDFLEQVANLQAGISEVGKSRFIKNFILSGIYAGAIQYSLRSKREVIILDEKIEAETSAPQPAEYQPAQSAQKAELKTSKGKAILIVPEELSKEDKTRLKSQIDLF